MLARPFHFALLALGLEACVAPPAEDAVSATDSIANGTVPVQGSQREIGVVRFQTGCSGTLLTNRHVLTARHCVREWADASSSWGADKTLGLMVVDLDTADPLLPEQGVVGGIVWEPDSATLEPDVAVVTVLVPMNVTGNDDDFFKPIFGGDPSTLAGQTVTCRGYGFGAFATSTSYASGSGVLRMGDFRVDAVTPETLRFLPNALGQIHMGGDSGSSCTLGDEIATVMFRADGDGIDRDGDGEVGNGEFTSVQRTFGVNPLEFRDDVHDLVHADLDVVFTYASHGVVSWPPELALRFTTPEQTTELPSYWSGIFEPVRSNFVEIEVVSEPANTLCSVARTVAPMDGDVTMYMSCLDEGLLAVLM